MTESSSDNKPASSSTSGSEKRLYIALGVLALLGGALYFQSEGKKAEIKLHSGEQSAAAVPVLSVAESIKDTATKIVIEKPAGGPEGTAITPSEKHVLVKDGSDWKLSEPLSALANKTNVESLLTSLPKLKVKEQIATSAEAYAQYDLSDDKATHVTVFEGDKAAIDLWIGKSGGRGQTARIQGQDGVIVLEGYSSYLFARDTKGWRDTSIFKLESDKATRVDITSENGSFELKKEGDKWAGSFKKAKGGSFTPIKDFDSSKVDDLLRAYKALNASGFGDGKSLSDAGLEKPLAELAITIGDAKTQVQFGSTAEGSSRYAKLPAGEQIFTVSSWASDWAFAEESKFQKKKDAAPAAPSTDPLE